MKKTLALILTIAMAVALFTGCTGTTVVIGECTCPCVTEDPTVAPETTPVEPSPVPVIPENEAAATCALKTGLAVSTTPEGKYPYVLAFDIGTTTVVAYLLDGRTGKRLAQASCLNPQAPFGADVISRIQYVLTNQSTELQTSVKEALGSLAKEAARKAGVKPGQIGMAAIVGNTAMHHLLLGIDPGSLTTPPYMPKVCEAMELPAAGLISAVPNATVRVLPNIAGFVGADTVGCLRGAIRLCRILIYPREAGILNINNGVGVVLARKLCGRDG